jgi:tight adherence protein C
MINVTASPLVPLAMFLVVAGAVFAGFLVVCRKGTRLDARLGELQGGDEAQAPQPRRVARLARSALPRMAAPLLPGRQEDQTLLRSRLIRAGLYGPQTMLRYLAVKLILLLGPWVVGLAVGLGGLASLHHAIVAGGLCSGLGLFGPRWWLNGRTQKRQRQLRRILPDALDVVLICLEAGLSVSEAFSRVVDELGSVDDVLGQELTIVQREVQMGESMGHALWEFAARSDLEEVRTLASLVRQSERLGGGLIQPLRVHAESLRTRRLQYAEETAQKASIKILFPTLLLIFPGVFLVTVGPAVLQVRDVMNKVNRTKPLGDQLKPPSEAIKHRRP